eukprot:TRINITY_DN12733_c0_g1_i8.p1 TRINITY_DN12733_c0_g1~~TRINITY_DN12733_c0_g1_i8.p1  ORF type:complete len:511 (+),score=129.61 TRINITY_DN12733_c0_g1_i8:153-1685(+)
MEVRSDLRLMRCKGNLAESHEEKVFGFCNKCGELVCPKCSATRHFDHFQAFHSYDLECAHLTNFITKLRRNTQKSLRTSDKLLPQLHFKPQINILESNITNAYSELITIIKEHCENYVAKVKETRIVKQLKNQLALLTEGRIKQMKELRAKLTNCKTKLITATISGKYFDNLQVVEEIKRHKLELEALVEAQQKETDAFHNQIQKFTAVYVATDLHPLSDICKIESIEHLDPKVYKICRETETLIAFSVMAKSVTEIRFSDYKLPYNSGLIEILETAYIIGGSVVNGIGGKEEFYLDKVAAIDLDSGILLYKDFMINKRMCFGVTASGGAIYVIGGYNHLKAIPDCEKFLIRTNTWQYIPKLQKEKSNTGVCTIDNKCIYCFGGYSNEGEEGAIEKLDIEASSKWETITAAGVWSSRQNPGAIQVGEGQILVFGGKHEDDTLVQSLIYFTEQNSFEEVESMKGADTFLGCKPILFDGRVHVFGCHDNLVHAYNVKDEVWETPIEVLVDNK